VILSVLFALRPYLTEVVDRLLQPEPPIEVRGPVGRLARQARDALGLAARRRPGARPSAGGSDLRLQAAQP
jgi:hypothetical protein